MDTAQELPRTETHDRWEKLPVEDQRIVVTGLARLMKTRNTDAIRRCCELGNPIIVRGIQYDKTYTRIHEDSLEMMRVLLNAYT